MAVFRSEDEPEIEEEIEEEILYSDELQQLNLQRSRFQDQPLTYSATENESDQESQDLQDLEFPDQPPSDDAPAFINEESEDQKETSLIRRLRQRQQQPNQSSNRNRRKILLGIGSFLMPTLIGVLLLLLFSHVGGILEHVNRISTGLRFGHFHFSLSRRFNHLYHAYNRAHFNGKSLSGKDIPPNKRIVLTDRLFGTTPNQIFNHLTGADYDMGEFNRFRHSQWWTWGRKTLSGVRSPDGRPIPLNDIKDLNNFRDDINRNLYNGGRFDSYRAHRSAVYIAKITGMPFVRFRLLIHDLKNGTLKNRIRGSPGALKTAVNQEINHNISEGKSRLRRLVGTDSALKKMGITDAELEAARQDYKTGATGEQIRSGISEGRQAQLNNFNTHVLRGASQVSLAIGISTVVCVLYELSQVIQKTFKTKINGMIDTAVTMDTVTSQIKAGEAESHVVADLSSRFNGFATSANYQVGILGRSASVYKDVEGVDYSNEYSVEAGPGGLSLKKILQYGQYFNPAHGFQKLQGIFDNPDQYEGEISIDDANLFQNSDQDSFKSNVKQISDTDLTNELKNSGLDNYTYRSSLAGAAIPHFDTSSWRGVFKSFFSVVLFPFLKVFGAVAEWALKPVFNYLGDVFEQLCNMLLNPVAQIVIAIVELGAMLFSLGIGVLAKTGGQLLIGQVVKNILIAGGTVGSGFVFDHFIFDKVMGSVVEEATGINTSLLNDINNSANGARNYALVDYGKHHLAQAEASGHGGVAIGVDEALRQTQISLALQRDYYAEQGIWSNIFALNNPYSTASSLLASHHYQGSFEEKAKTYIAGLTKNFQPGINLFDQAYADNHSTPQEAEALASLLYPGQQRVIGFWPEMMDGSGILRDNIGTDIFDNAVYVEGIEGVAGIEVESGGLDTNRYAQCINLDMADWYLYMQGAELEESDRYDFCFKNDDATERIKILRYNLYYQDCLAINYIQLANTDTSPMFSNACDSLLVEQQRETLIEADAELELGTFSEPVQPSTEPVSQVSEVIDQTDKILTVASEDAQSCLNPIEILNQRVAWGLNWLRLPKLKSEQLAA
ncbi:MAG: hypothetical protein OXF30_03170 [Candidatus Saccharibacteria bacterium]|nr:hypothetical protein [Candidatus Saccharibacteria bacterium]